MRWTLLSSFSVKSNVMMIDCSFERRKKGNTENQMKKREEKRISPTVIKEPAYNIIEIVTMR